MILLEKSRKKYHGSIMKCYRSIIKDSTMHEKNQFRYRKKLVLPSQKARLNITKYQKNIAQKQVNSLGIHCP